MSELTLVIVGNGMAANRILELIGDSHPFDVIHVLSEESIPHYNRIMLSPLLASETTLAGITPHDDNWYKSRKIQVHLNTKAIELNTQQKRVLASGGIVFNYDALVIATGSRSFIPDLPGTHEATNVIGFRDMNDVNHMLESLPTLRHATVIGAGLLGVEAAVGLKMQGAEVTLMHRNPVLMNRQLDAKASGILNAELRRRGIDVQTGVNPSELTLENGKATEVYYSNSAKESCTLPTDLVVFATGIQPNTDLAKSSGLLTQRGVCVDQHMRTHDEHIFSIGECCEFEGATYGLVAPIWDQAKVIAHQLQHWPEIHDESDRLAYVENEHLTKLKVSGLDMHSMGDFNPKDEEAEIITLDASPEGIYKKLVIRDNRIQGVLCVGEVRDSGWYFDLLKSQTDISDIRTQLIFGKAWCS
ncbi:MAG: NAD(P)/FAD-dependent oxidoreductase [Oceanobacter sp.]